MSVRLLLSSLWLSVAAIASAAPEVTWLETHHNFGAFDENDGKVTCQFRFVNSGDQPLAVTAARATCGCTAPSFPRHPIAPGDTASISVTYDPTGRPGRFEKKVYVDFDGLDRATLRIDGVVIGSANTLRSRYPVDAGAVRLRSSVVAMGDITKGRTKMAFFDVYNVTTDSITPSWSALPDYIHASAISPAIPPGEQIAYAINYLSDKTDLYGVLLDSIYFTPRPGDEPIKIDIVGMVNEDFTSLTPGERLKAPRSVVSASTVDLDQFSAYATAYASLSISNSGTNPLIIRRVYTSDPGVYLSVDKTKLKKGKSATISITVEPSQLPAQLLNARIIIITNDPDNPVRSIRLVGLPR